MSQRLKTESQAAAEYSGAPMPKDEDARYDQLCALNVLNTEADPRFDDITNLVRPRLCCGIASTIPVGPPAAWRPSVVIRSLSPLKKELS